MNIGIIGSGNMGAGLGALWTAAGHSVMFSYSRDPEKPARLAGAVGHGAAASTAVEAAAFGDVAFLAVPWSQVEDALREAAPRLTGKTLLTCVSPLRPDFSGQTTGIASPLSVSAAEHIAQVLAPGARVAEAFNLTFAELLPHGPDRFGPAERATVPFVADDAAARSAADALIRDAGFEPLDAGPLLHARVLEPLATAWVQFAAVTGFFPGAGLRVLRRSTTD